ncbi:MAG: lipoyl protein ligase domain-containing protein [Verrucomicrobiota bacterium]
MAIDESLLRHARAPVLRIYGWEETCVSIGYFQKASVVAAGTSFVRRYTGGGLVEHDKREGCRRRSEDDRQAGPGCR